MKQYVFHTFRMGDVEDPEIYASMPIIDWKATELGQWVMEHCPDRQYTIEPDEFAWGHTVVVHGPLDEKDAVVFVLKWEPSVKN